MGLLSKTMNVGAVLVLFFAVLLGVLLSGVPTRLGLFTWAFASSHHRGTIPQSLHGVEWGFTFEQLAAVDLVGQTALVTGGNSGVGFHAAVALAQQGASVTIACRNPSKCEAAAASIREKAHKEAKVETLKLDTSSLKSVRAAGATYLASNSKPLDMLLLNAGMGIGPSLYNKDGSFALSEDGIQIMFATNYVGHHLLYKLLAPRLKRSKMARIVLTSSGGHRDHPSYGVPTDLATANDLVNGVYSYGQSKLAQVLWAQELSRQLGPDSNIYVNSAHPGAVDSGLWDKMGLPFPFNIFVQYLQRTIMWTGPEGALTIVYLAVATEELKAKDLRGKYFVPQTMLQEAHETAKNLTLQKALWAFTDDLVKKK
uniref:Uncharacterized protein n=1 Tax=Fibrocapsa japonica TaxID=94617 RepID=A0A7S2XYE0_9STRA|mmetsp:Transcript_12884/g.19015  ORF Transcript_12884/g.19015 Transcript_12884/m.19015 type:complete len:370 (+) Transcript_12884:106-1215(+)